MKKYESMLLGAMGATIGIILLQVLSESSNIDLLVAPFGATLIHTFSCFEIYNLYLAKSGLK